MNRMEPEPSVARPFGANRPVHLQMDDMGNARVVVTADDGASIDLSNCISDSMEITITRSEVPMLNIAVPLLAVRIEQVESVVR